MGIDGIDNLKPSGGYESKEITHSGPDDPYMLKTRWDKDGIHIIVEAEVLPYSGDTTLVRAEVERRAQIWRDWLNAQLWKEP